MSDLHAREARRDDWAEPVVELVEEDRVVGLVYVDEGAPMAEFYVDEDGEPWTFDVGDLQQALDTAAAMLGLEVDTSPTGPAGHPVDLLAAEFDARAARRGPEDEGFYPAAAVAALLARCDSLDLAMVTMEGFSPAGGEMQPVSGLVADLADAHAGEPWPTFRAGCNVQARALLERWAPRTGLLVAVEVADRDGERYVL